MVAGQNVRLTSLASCAGCAAKMGPAALAAVVSPLRLQTPPAALLVGLEAADDAAVYQINEQQAVISTADFFPPVVDDAYAFGAIAAANALSDVYAMGGQVLMAINLVAWPDGLDHELLSEILRGGAETVARAGGAVVGGHTVTDEEPKYGLAVTGLVHPQHILTKGGAQPGDLLLLSKPLGTGLVTTAQKRDQVTPEDMQAALTSMMRLNRRASELLVQAGTAVHAVTDITGFSLLGHACEMAKQSKTSMRFTFAALPLLPGALRYAALDCVPGGTGRNASYFSPHVRLSPQLPEDVYKLVFDPQTSGGLFAAIDPALWPMLEQQAANDSEVVFWRVGEVTERVPNEADVLLEVV